ncbi:MAG: TonB family protein [Polyangiaceae bacterium]
MALRTASERRRVPRSRGRMRSSCMALALASTVPFADEGVVHAQAAVPAGVTPPEVQTHVDADYPSHWIGTGKHADILLALVVDSSGHVASVEVNRSSGDAQADEAAVRAVQRWTFVPATRRGRPVAAKIRVPFHLAPPEATKTMEPAPDGSSLVLPTTKPKPVEAPEPPPPTSEFVRVRGVPQPPSRGASDFNLKIGSLSEVPRKNATDILKLAPGILLTNDGGDGHPEQVFLRGFDAREGQDIEFSVGGVPVNEAGNLHGNGYADLHFVLPELVDSLRVIEGPFDPRQGNFAVAGSANYELGLEKRGLTAKYTHGSFGTQRLLVLFGPKEASTRTFGGAELFRTDGFGQNRAAKRATAMGQYEGSLGDSGSYRITATAYANDYRSAGLLRADDVARGRVGFFDTYDARQGGASQRFSIAADLDAKSGDILFRQNFFVISSSLRLMENFTGFLLDVQTPFQSLHAQRGDLLDLAVSGTTIGAKGSARWRGKFLGEAQEVELGYFARGDKTHSAQSRLDATTSAPYLLETDLDSKLADVGLYADANLRVTPWLGVRGGVRADLFAYDVLDGCAQKDVRQPSSSPPPGDASCFSQQDQGRYREPVQRTNTASTAMMPRGSVILGPFTDFTFSASYGMGVRSIDPVYVNQGLDTPFATIHAYDGGVSWGRSVGSVDVTARSVFFQTKVERDFIFSETAGRNVLSNGTTRTGWVGALRATGSFFDQAANVTLVRSTFDDTHLLIPYVPDLVLRSDSSLFHDLPWRVMGDKVRGAVSAGITYVGHRPLPYGQRSDTIFTVDASMSASWKAFELAFVATNLGDRRYRLGEYNFASNFRSSPQATLVPARHFSAGAPQAFFVNLSMTLGGADERTAR